MKEERAQRKEKIDLTLLKKLKKKTEFYKDLIQKKKLDKKLEEELDSIS